MTHGTSDITLVGREFQMVSEKRKLNWKVLAITAAGLGAFLIYILVFRVDLAQIVAMVESANLTLYALAGLAAILDVLLSSVAWNILLRFLTVRLSLLKSFLYVWFGIYVDTLIPAESISGEIAKIYLVSKEVNGNPGRTTASLVVQRLISMGINICTLFLGVLVLLVRGELPSDPLILDLILFLISVTFAFLILILLLCVKETWTLRIADAIIGFADRISRGRWKLYGFREGIIEAAEAFHCGMRDFAHAPKTVIAAISLFILSWIMNLSLFYLTFLSIGYAAINWGTILFVCSIFMAVKSIPIGVPFEVGLPEITLTTLFSALGVEIGVSTTVTILSRILTHWMRFFIGFGAQQWIGVRASVALGTENKSASETGKT